MTVGVGTKRWVFRSGCFSLGLAAYCTCFPMEVKWMQTETLSPASILALPPLAAMNVAMGAAYPSGDADFPITPKCELTAKDCERPLRLHGLPVFFGSQPVVIIRMGNGPIG